MINYIFNDTLKTKKEIRQSNEKKKIKSQLDIQYPSIKELKEEDNEEKPYYLILLYLMIIIRKLEKLLKPKIGFNNVVWNFRLTPQNNISLKSSSPGRYSEAKNGPLALPGKYYVTMHKVENGKSTMMVDKTPFECEWLNQLSTPTDDKIARLSFQLKVDKIRKAIDASSEVLKEDKKRLEFIKSAFKSYPNLDITYLSKIRDLDSLRKEIKIKLYGDESLSKRDIEQKESISSKVEIIIWNMWRNRSNPTITNKNLYESASNSFEKLIVEIQNLDLSIKGD